MSPFCLKLLSAALFFSAFATIANAAQLEIQDKFSVKGYSEFGSTVAFSGKVGISTAVPQGIFDVGGGQLLVSSTTGNVGIGTTNPVSKLHVEGDITVNGNLNISTGSNLSGNLDTLLDKISLLTFQMQNLSTTTVMKSKDGISDSFVDQNGIDVSLSSHQVYNSGGRYYQPEQEIAGLDAYAKLLLHLNGPNGAKEIIDNGGAGHVVTQNGTAQLKTDQKKFGSSSVWFNGSSDYLTVPDSDDWDLGTTFTIDCWIKAASSGIRQGIVNRDGWPVSPSNRSFIFYINASDHPTAPNRLVFTDIANTLTGAGIVTNNDWHHVAIVCNSGTGQIYLDGAADGSSVVGLSVPNVTLGLNIGVIQPGSNEYFNGYMDELRISKGIARWNTNFSTSTLGEYTSDNFTALLLHCNTQDVSDSHNIPKFYVGAQLDAAQKEFGTASLKLDGIGDYVSFADSSDWAFGSGNFTIDLWLKAFNPASGAVQHLVSQYNNANDDWVNLRVDATGHLQFKLRDAGAVQGTITDTNTLAANAWQHAAVVRNGGVFRLYKNGTEVGSSFAYSASLTDISNLLTLGVLYTTGLAEYFGGWLDEVRVSKGMARWTTNFTPPTVEYSTNTSTYDMTLVSQNAEAETKPSQARLIALVEPVDPITPNEHLKGFVSEDNGVNYDTVTFADEGAFAGTQRIYAGSVVLTDRSDKTMRQKITTHNGTQVKLHGWSLSWK